jgi:hypothetical protein
MDFRGFRTRDLRPFSWVVIMVGLCALSVSGRPQASSQTKSVNNNNRVARGKYIVEGVAMCGMCHTPRTDSESLMPAIGWTERRCGCYRLARLRIGH